MALIIFRANGLKLSPLLFDTSSLFYKELTFKYFSSKQVYPISLLNLVINGKDYSYLLRFGYLFFVLAVFHFFHLTFDTSTVLDIIKVE